MVAVDLEREALLVALAVHHQRPAVAGELCDPAPQKVPDPRGDVADEDSGGYFEQPARELTPETLRATGEDDDDHQKSRSSA